MNFFTFDTEDNGRGTPYLWNFYNPGTGTHYTFKKEDEALDFIFSLKDVTLWAVNLEYDIINSFKGNFRNLKMIYAGSRMIIAEIGTIHIRFLDTLNHWPMSVAKMGERIGLPKLEYAHTGKIPRTKAEWAKSIEYCRRDTEIAGRFVGAMLAKYESVGAECKSTMAATTLKFFEETFYRKVTHFFTEREIDFFHTGYYGGRNEIFFNKKIRGPVFGVDINSLYPRVMQSGIFPVLSGHYKTKTPDFTLEGMVDCEVEAPSGLHIPYLPYRSKNKLIFPIGEFRGTYTYFEIREAKKLGYKITKIYKAIEFPGKFNPFKKFIDTVYAKRLEAKAAGDDLLQEVYKNFMNHGYGKFGQSNISTELVHIDSLEGKIPDGAQILDGEMVLINKKKKYPPHANCIWACYVTAQGRHELYKKGLSVINETPDAVLLYCDTDSVYFKAAKNVLGDSKDLGEFKLEYPKDKNGNKIKDYYDYAHFKLPKMYELIVGKKREYKAKGVPKSVSGEYFKGINVKYRKPMKLRQSLRRNSSKSKLNRFTPNEWVENSKQIRGNYSKRIVLSSGATLPLHVNLMRKTTNEKRK